MGFTAMAAIESQKASAFCFGVRSLKLSASSCKNPVWPTRSTSGDGAALSCAKSLPPASRIKVRSAICLSKMKLPASDYAKNALYQMQGVKSQHAVSPGESFVPLEAPNPVPAERYTQGGASS